MMRTDAIAKNAASNNNKMPLRALTVPLAVVLLVVVVVPLPIAEATTKVIFDRECRHTFHYGNWGSVLANAKQNSTDASDLNRISFEHPDTGNTVSGALFLNWIILYLQHRIAITDSNRDATHYIYFEGNDGYRHVVVRDRADADGAGPSKRHRSGGTFGFGR